LLERAENQNKSREQKEATNNESCDKKGDIVIPKNEAVEFQTHLARCTAALATDGKTI